MDCSMSGFPVHHQLLELVQIHVTEMVMPSNHLILCRPLLLLPSIFPSIRVFSNESVLCIRWPEYWSFSFNISPSNEYSGLISFKMDWLDLLAVQETLKSLLQHHSSKAYKKDLHNPDNHHGVITHLEPDILQCYDQHRQHIKKQRHYFAKKGPSSQSYGFSSSHVWM